MPVIARRTGDAISKGAKARINALKTYPALDTWRNPLTRGIARRLANDAWLKTLDELDFEYRMSDTEIGDVACVSYETGAANDEAPLILYIHGGDFVAGSARTHAANVLPLCHLTGAQGLGVDYSLLPETPFPTQIDETDRVYRSLIEHRPERKVILMSDGVGSAIALAAMMRWRDDGVAAPAGAICLSPSIDGAGASDTQITLDGEDPLIRSQGGKHVRRLFRFYAPGGDLRDAAISPIYGEFEWLPPMMIHVGSREVLLGDAARLAEAARLASVAAHLRVFDGMFHLFHLHWGLEEARTAHADLADFVATL